MSDLRKLAPGEEAKKYGWDEYSPQEKEKLLALMPEEVRRRVKSGQRLSDQQIAGYIQKYYDLGHKVVLWMVDETNPSDKRPMRIMIADAFSEARKALRQKHGPQVDGWTDVQIMSFNLPPKRGFRWLLTHEKDYAGDAIADRM